ncbi:hypothetical protein ACFL6U_24290 [Planctomycetota bacterium]
MKPLSSIEVLIKKLRVDPRVEQSQQNLADAWTAQEKSWSARNNDSEPTIWRIIMRSPITRSAAIIVFGIVILSVLLPWPNGLTESVAFADVQQTLTQQETVLMRGTRTCTFLAQDGNEPETLTFRVEKISGPQGHLDKTLDEEGNVVLQVCLDYPSHTATILFSKLKHYYRFSMPPTVAASLQGMSMSEKFEFVLLGGKYQPIADKNIGDIEAVGFLCEQTKQRLFDDLGIRFLQFFIAPEQGHAKMWVHPDTKLPIELEINAELAPSAVTLFQPMQFHEVDNHFEWGISIDTAVFLPEAPEAYTTIEWPFGS